jgi:hypothetical protein
MENMAEMLHATLEKLGIEGKILTIAADNATNNESLVSELFFSLKEKFKGSVIAHGETNIFRFQGVDSYIRCLAHVVNLIVGDILSALKFGDYKAAATVCDLMQENKDIGMHSAVSRLRIISLWIARTPQRKQQLEVI